MTYSLRRVLAVRFSLTMLIALALIALWALLAFERTLRQQTDQTIASAGSLADATLAAGLDIAPQPEPRDFETFVQRVNRFVVVRDPAGGILQSNTALAADLPLDTAALRQAGRGDPAWVTQRWHDARIRSRYGSAPQVGPGGTLVVQVAASLEPLAEANRRLLFVMFGTVILGTLATAFGAFWLAGSAVQPVLEVAGQARSLTPEMSGKRITAHADVSEYESLIAVLNGLLARCEAAFNNQRQFIGDVGHELRTPLTSLQGQIEVALRAERSPRDYQLVLEGALEEIQHLSRMSDSLMLITQAESHALVTHRSPTDLGTITQHVLDGERRRIEEKELDVTVTREYAGPALLLDARLCTRVVQELVDNAVKFSPNGGGIAIGTRGTRQGEEWWIEDSGPGIPADDLPRLFEPFYRVDPARSRDGGSGLGLTLAASLARLHGATIHAENLPRGGARFTVAFPAPAAEAAA